jgi:hypothetical protein
MRRPHTGEAEIRVRMGKVIEARRASMGIAPAMLAQAAEVDDRQMARVLAGKGGLSFHSLGRVAAALKTTAPEILREALVRRPSARRAVRQIPQPHE